MKVEHIDIIKNNFQKYEHNKMLSNVRRQELSTYSVIKRRLRKTTQYLITFKVRVKKIFMRCTKTKNTKYIY